MVLNEYVIWTIEGILFLIEEVLMIYDVIKDLMDHKIQSYTIIKILYFLLRLIKEYEFPECKVGIIGAVLKELIDLLQEWIYDDTL